MVKLNCQVCGKEYFRTPSASKKSKHCSMICHNKIAGRIGGKAKKPGVNLGIKRPYLTLRNLTNNPAKRGSENFFWKGDEVGYIALHQWMRKHFEWPDSCEKCGSKNNLHLSNKSQTYKRDKEDWWILCPKCHKKYDKDKIKIIPHRWTKQNPQ